MRGAGNTWVIVADGLLATPGQLIFRKLEHLGDQLAQVILDDFLILRSRRHNLRIEDQPGIIKPVAMIEDAARRLGAGVASGRARLDFSR